MPKYRIKSDILGVDFGIQTDQKLTERDYFDILKTKVSPQKMLRAYKQNKDDEKVQALATKALDNNYFEGADFGTAFSEGAKSFGRGVKNMLVTNIYGTSRLLDATMQYGEADESQRYDELVEEGIKKAGQQLKGLSYASKRTDRTIEQDLSQALQFAGLSQEDENLKKRVIAEARRQDNSQAEATRAQMGVDAVGMMSMLGAKLFQGLGDAKDIATGEVSFGGDSKERKLRQLDYLIEQDYIGRTIERGAELGLQLGGALSTISQVYTGMDLSPFEKNEEALRDVRSGLVKPDRDVAMLGSMFADPGMGATVLASGGLAFGRNFIARGAIIKTGQKAAQESALKSTIAQLSDIANPTNTQKALLKTAEKNLAKVTGSGEKLEKLVAKAEGIAQAEAGKLLQKGQGNTPMAARLFQAIDKAPPPKAPFSNRMTGKILEKAGVSAEYLGRTIEFLQRLPEETLGTLFMRSGMDEQAAMTAARATARTLQGTAAAGVVTGGFNEFTPELENLGLALLLAPGGSSLVTRFGHDAAILGKQLQYAQTSSPLFQRIAQLDPADSSLTAVTLDRTSALTIPGTISGLAEGIFAKSRQFGPSPALKAPATALTRTGLGNTLTGAVNATKTAIGASAIPGAIGYAVDGEAGAGGAIAASIPFIAAGLGFGTLARYGSQADVRAKMLGDQAYYKDTYLTDTEVGMYDSLAKPVRQAIATSVIQNPDVVYRFQNDRGNSHWSVENGESVVTIFTKSAPQEQLSAVLGHEIAHHIDAFGFMPQIIEQLVGSVEKNQPGLFTEYKNGKPVVIKDAEGRDVYATNKEFAKHRQRYLDLLEQSGIDKNSPDYQAYANDDSRIAREIFASHGAAWYFGGDFVTRNYQGAGAKMMGAILDPLFNSSGLRKFFHRIGLATQETTGLVADPLRLFPELKEVPALTRMIEKYNDDVRGFGPQARREGRGRGNLVDPEFADEIATASLTAKDLENPAIVNRLKAGGVVKIKDDGSIETDASGKPVFLPSREVNKNNKQLSQDILQIIRKKEDAGETFGEGHVSMEKTADGKERAAGRFLDPSIIDELAKTGKYNPHQLAALKQISQTLRNNTGDVWNLFYYSALKWNKAGRKVYGQIKGGDRKSLPFGIEITKDGNINIQTISVDAFKKNLEWFAKSKGYEKKMSEAFGGMNAWENAQNAYKLLPTYLQNHMNRIINGEKGSGITPLQRDLINAAIGRVNADQVKANPILEGLGDRRSQRQQSIRSRRLDRIGNAIRGESGFPAFKSAIEQNKVPMFMPGRGEGDKLFMPQLAMQNDPNVKYHYDTKTMDRPPVKTITALSGERLAGVLEADRHDARGSRMAGPAHPFLKSNQVTAKVDGVEWKPVWANMKYQFVKTQIGKQLNSTNGYNLVAIMDEFAHRSNRDVFTRMMKKIQTASKKMTPEQKIITAQIINIFDIRYTPKKERTQSLQSSMDSFISDLGTAKSQATRGNLDGFNQLLNKAVSKVEGKSWWSDNNVKSNSKDFRKYTKDMTFNKRGAILKALEGLPWLPDIQKFLKSEMDFEGAPTDKAILAVQLSKHKLNSDERVFAIYTGKDPEQAKWMTDNERKVLKQLRANPKFREHPSYDWMMLGRADADNFYLDQPVDLDKLIPSYRSDHKTFKKQEYKDQLSKTKKYFEKNPQSKGFLFSGKGDKADKAFIKTFLETKSKGAGIENVYKGKERLVVGAMKRNSKVPIIIP